MSTTLFCTKCERQVQSNTAAPEICCERRMVDLSYGNVYCQDCGAIGSSKCPWCRSVFGGNATTSNEFLLTNIIKVLGSTDSGFHLILHVMKSDNAESTEETLRSLHHWLDTMIKGGEDIPTLAQFTCPHHWKWVPGHSSSIGCGH